MQSAGISTPTRQANRQVLSPLSLEYSREPSTSHSTEDGFLTGIAEAIKKDFGNKLSMQFLHLVDVESESSQTGIDTKWLEITSCTVNVCQDIGPLFSARLVVSSTHTYYLQVTIPVVRNVSAGICDEASHLYPIVQQLLPGSGYIACSGIHDYNDQYYRLVRHFQFKNLQTVKIGEKVIRYESINCQLWHRLPEVRGKLSSRRFNMCNECKTTDLSVSRRANRESKVPEAQKALRTSTESNYPVSWLSPSSQKVRVRRLMRERKALLERIEKYDCTRITLDDEQDKEVRTITSTIDNNDVLREQLDDIFMEADKHQEGHGAMLQDIWEADVATRDLNDFKDDQERNSKIFQ